MWRSSCVKHPNWPHRTSRMEDCRDCHWYVFYCIHWLCVILLTYSVIVIYPQMKKLLPGELYRICLWNLARNQMSPLSSRELSTLDMHTEIPHQNYFLNRFHRGPCSQCEFLAVLMWIMGFLTESKMISSELEEMHFFENLIQSKTSKIEGCSRSRTSTLHDVWTQVLSHSDSPLSSMGFEQWFLMSSLLWNDILTMFSKMWEFPQAKCLSIFGLATSCHIL